MIPLVRASLRAHLHKGRLLTALTVLGVALGVAAVLSVQILNASSLATFRGGVRAVSGDADLTVTGRGPELPTAALAMVLADPEVAAAWPLVRLRATLAGDPTTGFEVLGVDPFSPMDRDALTAAPAALNSGAAAGDPLDLLTRTDWAATTLEAAARHGWAEGDTVRLGVGSRTVALVLGAVLDVKAAAPFAPSSLLLVDLAEAQRLRRRPDAFTQIDLALVPGADPAAAAARLEAALGTVARVRTPGQREQDTASLTEAFRMNLSALSLVSVFVGVFLVVSTVQASLVRRRTEFGVLRAHGATRGEVLRLILLEAGTLGLLGVAVGVPLGWLTARANLELVGAALTNIYMLDGLERLEVPWHRIALAAATGAGGAALGALVPALDVARREPRDLLRRFTAPEGASRAAPVLAGVGLTVVGVSLLWFFTAGRDLRWAGFLLGLALLLGVVLLTPEVVRRLGALARPRRFGPLLGLRNLAVRLNTTSFAVAALGVAVSMLVSVTLLIAGFRDTLVSWLDGAVPADVYVTAESWARAGPDAELDPAAVAAILADPDVRAHAVLRRTLTEAAGREVAFNGVRAEGADPLPPLRDGDPAAFRAALRDGAVGVTEPFARKTGLGVGDRVPVMTPAGLVDLPIAGVTYDYSSEHGAVYASLATLERLFGPGELHSLALFLRDGAVPETVAARLRLVWAGRPLEFRANAELRREVLAIFDQTFAVTRLLQGTALLIAVAGIALTLLIRARERGAELALYRALGATPAQVFRLVLGEGVGIGLLGLALGLAGGVGLALLLVHVINPAWFGWTLQQSWPVGRLAGQAFVILAAAGLAAVEPARRCGRALARELTLDDA